MDINTILERGVAEVIEKEHLKKRLEDGNILRVKLGIDPTAKDLHLGHTVVLRKLKNFQDIGHQAVLIIGDFTATVGDPSGRNELRPILTEEQIKENMSNYLKEAGKVLDISKTEVRYNSEWFRAKGPGFLFDLASKFTVARSLERDDFQKRLKENKDVSVLELIYPLLQGYDSVAVNADVEIGGTDQKFNLLVGRKVQRRYDKPEQDVVIVPLIEGLDGVRKMSKSYGNYIAISDTAEEMFNKTMSIPDDLMMKYFELLTDISQDEISRLGQDHLHPNDASLKPIEWKKKLAHKLVETYHDISAADKAQNNFERIFSKKELPENIPEYKIEESEIGIVDLMTKSGLVSSKTESKRLLEQGAVSVNGEIEKNWEAVAKRGDVIKIGPRKFIKVF